MPVAELSAILNQQLTEPSHAQVGAVLLNEPRLAQASAPLTRLAGKPQPPISLSPNDGGYSNFCMCDECKKLDPPE